LIFGCEGILNNDAYIYNPHNEDDRKEHSKCRGFNFTSIASMCNKHMFIKRYICLRGKHVPTLSVNVDDTK
jgi:hypothetical protein